MLYAHFYTFLFKDAFIILISYKKRNLGNNIDVYPP